MGPEKAGDFPKVTQRAANLGPEPSLLPPHPVLWSLHHGASRTWRGCQVLGLFTCQPQGEVGERGVCVLLPSRAGDNKQLEGAIISEVPTVGWMLCNSPLQKPSGVSYHLH